MRIRVHRPREPRPPSHPTAERIARELPREMLALSNALILRDIMQRYGISRPTAVIAAAIARTSHEAP